MPFFAHKQSLSFQAISGLVCQSPAEPPSFISIHPRSCGVPDPSLKYLLEPVDARSSSSGLICFQARTDDKAYYICNPVTKQWKKLPKINADHGPDPAVVLVFEPSLLNFVADYKLVCDFPSIDFYNATEFEIYSSAEGSWEVSGEICFASRKLVSRSVVHGDRVVYWQAKPHGFVAFDLTKDRSQLIQGCSNSTLGMRNGKLCSVHADGHLILVKVLSNVYSNMMQMKSSARTWEEETHFCLDKPVLARIICEQDSVLFVGCNVVLVQTGGKNLCYDLKTKGTRVLFSAAEYGTRYVSYVNFLVCI